jgi:hypothetical protein
MRSSVVWGQPWVHCREKGGVIGEDGESREGGGERKGCQVVDKQSLGKGEGVCVERH